MSLNVARPHCVPNVTFKRVLITMETNDDASLKSKTTPTPTPKRSITPGTSTTTATGRHVCLLATLGPRVLRNKVLRGKDWAAFLLTSMGLLSNDMIRKEVGLVVNNLKNLQESTRRSRQTFEYLFANPK
jgi:hypothetical protein